MIDWEPLFVAKVTEISEAACDPSHDLLHFRRVARSAAFLARESGAELAVVTPAAWLHDFVPVRKDDPRRKQASRLSAEAATAFLRSVGYPEGRLGGIHHAIEAHSFSAGIPPRTLEARVVQDADRLDALGAIGVARCFATTGTLARPLYAEIDPFCDTREPDDSLYALDHFYRKLLKLPETFTTDAGRALARKRADAMRAFLDALRDEIP